MSVELIWDGKYDADGRRKSPLKIALPFQTVETINESVQDRQKNLFAAASQTEWRNRLIWADKKYCLPSLLPEFAGKVNLIYIDPPFFTGTDQKLTISIPDSEEHFIKEPSLVETAAYRNIWRKGSDSFCEWIYETLASLRELLTEDGAIFIRFDQYWAHYVKVIADEVFGKQNFKNDITLKRIYKNQPNSQSKFLQLATDALYLYFKSDKSKFYEVEEALDETRAGYWRIMDDSAGANKLPERTILGKTYYPPAGKHFKFSQKNIDEMIKQNKIRINDNGRPQYWVEPSDKKPLTSNWTDISGYSFTTGYPTENSEDVLERVIRLCSKENDLVLDCFCGSGTTAAVAEKLGRRWITCDLGRFAIHTARKRLLSIPNVKPFVVQNLGKYERQAWQKDEFGANSARRIDAYVKFILELYHAEKLNDFAWLHGVRNGRVVHIGAVDSPVTLGDVKAIILEWKKTLGFGGNPRFSKGANASAVEESAVQESALADARASAGESAIRSNGIDVLGWEFALDLNETARQQAAEAGVDMKFVLIPREVLEKKAVEQGDIQFFELAALFTETRVKKKELQIELKNFIAPLDYVPQDIREKIKDWKSWIDYWAVDFDFKGDTFHNQWQSYRTRKERKLDVSCKHNYSAAGVYSVQVKVIDILGNDTTKTFQVEV